MSPIVHAGPVDERTRRARSFDRVAEEYDRGRPGYPDDALDLLPVEATATVLDLAAGTGKLTRVLARRYRRVIAVEPLDAMRALIVREAPAAEALDGRAEAIPLADAEVDAVFVAQAMHWFANDVAVAEIARVLRPGGVLAVLRNEVDDDAG
jgi:ubiquinone/menaquinone biosynthesis C-methylase UbiE